MTIAVGSIAICLGTVSMAGSIIRACQLDAEKSHREELCVIGWFILAVMCLR